MNNVVKNDSRDNTKNPSDWKIKFGKVMRVVIIITILFLIFVGDLTFNKLWQFMLCFAFLSYNLKNK